MLNKLVQKYQKMALPVKAAMWFMLCSVIPQGINVIMTTIFTRILSTSDYGLTSNYSAWYNIMSIFITLNLNCGVYNNAMLKYKDRRDEYTSATMGLSLLLGFIGIFIVLVFHNQLSILMHLPFSLLICLGLQCLLYNSYGCWISRVRYEYNYRGLVKITLLVSIISPLLSVILICFSKNKAIGKVWGQNLIYIILGVIFYGIAISKSSRLYDKEFWKFALKFNIPLIPHYLSLVLLNQSDRVMITSMCGTSDNGLYSVAYSAASLLLILNSGITQAMTPWIYSQVEKGDIIIIKRIVTILCALYAVIDIVFMLLAPEAIFILAGKKYQGAIPVIPLVAASMYLIFLYNMYSIVEFYYEKTKPVMICSTFSACLNLVLNYYYIPRFGFIAAAYTTLACYLINALMHIMALKWIYKQKSQGNEIINTKSSFAIGFVLMVVSLMIGSLYPYTIIRLIIICIAFLVAIINRKKLITIFNTIKGR